jgi:hypothetical protein
LFILGTHLARFGSTPYAQVWNQTGSGVVSRHTYTLDSVGNRTQVDEVQPQLGAPGLIGGAPAGGAAMTSLSPSATTSATTTTTLANSIEQLAAEVLSRYLPEQDGIEPPCVFIDHYPDRQPRGPEALSHDPFFGETFDQVTFDRRSLKLRRVRRRAASLVELGVPDWRHLDRDTVEGLVGGRVPWPACTCRTRPGSANT